MQCVWTCQKRIQTWFYCYGYFLGTHPLWFIIIPLIVCGALGIGFLKLEINDDPGYLYVPRNSRASHDLNIMYESQHTFGRGYFPLNQDQFSPGVFIIFRSKKEKAIFTEEVRKEISKFLTLLEQATGLTTTLNRRCKDINGTCVVLGLFFLEEAFLDKVKARNVTYPYWREQPGVDLSRIFANVDVSNETLLSAGTFKLSFPLWYWNKETEFDQLLRDMKFTTVNMAYSSSSSVTIELEKGTLADVIFLVLTLILMVVYTCIVSSGGDCVSSRVLLAIAGMIGVVFGILGGFGIVVLCEVPIASLVGTMPFLILGIGVDDMFLLMGSWSETLQHTDLTIPERMGLVFKKAGVGITITSVTDFLAFVIGSTSVFNSVRNFSVYSGVAIIMCYFCNACMFGGCLALHARRVYSSRHTMTCQKVHKSKSELKHDGANCCRVYLCGGKIPHSADDDQSIFERWPQKILVKIFLWNPAHYIILLIFAVYLGISIWGCTKLQEGLELKHLAPESSYYYKFQTWDDEDFGMKMLITFITAKPKNYTDSNTLKDMADLLAKAKNDPLIDSRVEHCWLMQLARTDLYNTTSEKAFSFGLHQFLEQNPHLKYDVYLSGDDITGSQCHVYSNLVTDSTRQAKLMLSMREIADSSPADVFAYNINFILIEQYVVILQSTLQTVGITVAVIFAVTCVFLPHPLMVLLVTAQVVMILVGVIGFMAHWNLTLSAITMIVLIMSVGFSVNFCAHVCSAFMMSEKTTRQDRARDAIVHASSPVFNAAVSSFIGVFMLIFTESYIFQTFFKIMLLVLAFGVLHAAFLVPVILSLIGPSGHVNLDETSEPVLEMAGGAETEINDADASSKEREDSNDELHLGATSV